MTDISAVELDLAALDDADFKEDAVREEIIRPLLVRLGYASSGDSRIIRSKALVNPFVMIGTTKHPIGQIPDYLLSVADKFRWVLDAKAPGKVITSGQHVDQAYSYAIHPDIRVQLYALCNGREFVLFNVSQKDPIMHFQMGNLEENWPSLYEFLSPARFRRKGDAVKPNRRVTPAVDYLTMTPPPEITRF